jgi:hypothetical protein
MSSTGKTDSPKGNPKTLQALVVAACISEVTGKKGFTTLPGPASLLDRDIAVVEVILKSALCCSR